MDKDRIVELLRNIQDYYELTEDESDAIDFAIYDYIVKR